MSVPFLEIESLERDTSSIYPTDIPPPATFGGVAINGGGFGSALTVKPGSANEVYGLTDCGPNLDGPDGATIEPLPDVEPSIGLFRLTHGHAELLRSIPLQESTELRTAVASTPTTTPSRRSPTSTATRYHPIPRLRRQPSESCRTPWADGITTKAAKKGVTTRIVTYSLATGAVHGHVYVLDSSGTGVSEITALSNSTFLMDERDGDLPSATGHLGRGRAVGPFLDLDAMLGAIDPTFSYFNR